MHISLDAALQRQPLLSTVGDKLLPSFPGAAAAYSLRALNGDANNVVNVRRDADDEERDFTAEGVALELENWVNGKLETTLPADVATAAAAYSLRKVRNAYTGNAVQIRRASDDVEVNVAFDSNGEVSTSSAITNVDESPDAGDTTATTLGEFLTEATPARNRTGSSRYDTFIPDGVTGFTAITNNIAAGGFDIAGASGTEVQVSFDITVNSGSVNVKLRPDFETGSDVSNNETITTSGSKSFTLTATDDFKAMLFITASADYVISNFSVNVPYNHDATVVTWYDQSGNGYDATQDTTGSQPKIAENGSLVTDASGKPRLKIDGINDFFLLPSGFSVQTAVGVTEFDSTGTDFQGWAYLRDTAAPTNGNIRTNNTSPQTYRRDTTAEFVNNSSGDLFVNGVDTTSVSEDEKHLAFAVRQNAITLTTDNVAYPALFQGDSSRFMKGFGYEVILYSSDQSANRFKIESNINNHYGIYNTAYDGFVETWYDQSGNGRHASQTATGLQPKIVSNGSIITDDYSNPAIRFVDGSSNVLYSVKEDLDPALELSVFVVQKDEKTVNQTSAWFSMRNSNSVANLTAFELGVFANTNFRIRNDPLADGANVDDTFSTSGNALNTTTLMTAIKKSNGDLDGLEDGASIVDISVTDNSDYGSGFGITIGKHNNTAQYANGVLNEVILYLSDQSANRTAIESNIADEYGITLS